MTYAPPPIEHRAGNFQNAFTRTFAPKVLQVVHVTGNKEVAGYPEGFSLGQTPGQDWAYAARNPGSKDGPSANDYVGRKGTVLELWNPATHAAWSNGDLVSPRTELPGVKYLVDLKAKGVNANRGCYREIELSGYPGSFDPTDAQIETCAYFAAIDSITTGLDIVKGTTILTHAYINTIDRQNCAFRPVIREKRLDDLVARGREIRTEIQGGGDVVVPIPVGKGGPFDVVLGSGDQLYNEAFQPTRTVPGPETYPGLFYTGNGYIGIDHGGRLAFVKSSQAVVVTPKPADCTAAIAADRAKAHIVYS